MTIYKVENRK